MRIEGVKIRFHILIGSIEAVRIFYRILRY